MNTYKETQETVIRDIIDPNGQVVLKNAIIHRTVIEQILGFNAMLCPIPPRIMHSTNIQIHNETFLLNIKMLTYLSDNTLFTAWVTKQLPWSGLVKHQRDGSFHMATTAGVEISALLNNPGGVWAYIYNHSVDQIYLVKARPDNNTPGMRLTHPSVANTNQKSIACLGVDDLKPQLKIIRSRIAKETLQKLYFNRFNEDWMDGSVIPNNSFHAQQNSARLTHVYQENTPAISISEAVILPYIDPASITDSIIYEPTQALKTENKLIEI